MAEVLLSHAVLATGSFVGAAVLLAAWLLSAGRPCTSPEPVPTQRGVLVMMAGMLALGVSSAILALPTTGPSTALVVAARLFGLAGAVTVLMGAIVSLAQKKHP
jgi:hypothetical protein